ncbi:MAG: hypothetical protein HC902_12625 [Calothrix sp. SM1_5_4]|nr:hypothetical protein [Calothrix sp. SM1_5_4]
MFIADLHVHSRFSDGQMTIPQLVDFYGSRGFGCIAVTDHICERRTLLGLAARYLNLTLDEDTFPAYLQTLEEERERAWRRYRMVVLPGFEISKNSLSNHRSAHILGLGVTEFVAAEGEIVDITRAIRAQGALTVAAHPVPTGKSELQTLHLWNRRDELAQEFDAWEVASGDTLFEDVRRSGLPMLANSDLHHARQIHSWKTVFDCERHPEAILDAIRDQRLSFRFYEETVRQPVAVDCLTAVSG